MVRMLQDDRLLYEEQFTLKAGEEIVLAACEGYDDGRSPSRTDFGERRSNPIAHQS